MKNPKIAKPLYLRIPQPTSCTVWFFKRHLQILIGNYQILAEKGTSGVHLGMLRWPGSPLGEVASLYATVLQLMLRVPAVGKSHIANIKHLGSFLSNCNYTLNVQRLVILTCYLHFFTSHLPWIPQHLISTLLQETAFVKTTRPKLKIFSSLSLHLT